MIVLPFLGNQYFKHSITIKTSFFYQLIVKTIKNVLRYYFPGKAKRIKQAREEAQAEIEKYRQERDRQFKEFEVKYMGSKTDIAAKIDKNTEIHIENMAEEVQNKKEQVIVLLQLGMNHSLLWLTT